MKFKIILKYKTIKKTRIYTDILANLLLLVNYTKKITRIFFSKINYFTPDVKVQFLNLAICSSKSTHRGEYVKMGISKKYFIKTQGLKK